MNSIPRFIGLAILGILLAGGVISSFYVPAIEAALTVPASDSGAGLSIPATSTSTPGKAVTPVTTNILSRDTFQRADQLFWGTASDGHSWGADASRRNVFAIAGRRGVANNGQGAFDATLGPLISDAEVMFSGSMSRYDQSNIGAVLRWTDTNDWYKSYIDGNNLVVLKRVGGMATRLAAVPFVAKAGTLYTLCFRVKGSKLMAKVWQNGNSEPVNWMVTVVDTTFQSGYGGLRFVLAKDKVARFTSFQETAVTANS
jgi:hypothetical protein